MISNKLKPYKTLVEFLGNTLGPDYEIVLQDLTLEEPAIIAIANEHISGRGIGSPLTNTALQLLSSKTYQNNNYVSNYKGVAENGHMLRSSTMFIKDDDGIPIGLLCINFDDSRFTDVIQKLSSLIHPEGFGEIETSSETETFPTDIPSLMQKIFDDCTFDLENPADRLNQQERKDVITKLNEQGLFQLKGAISFVARKFSCSTATVYRYLSEVTN